ncbi:MAG: molybdopterin molybdenumtransferase MoeA [Anaerolineaceae bacterium]|nr:molybdopterin molybdenumtransferase MoeA [Anaerolineaceae bacterium]
MPEFLKLTPPDEALKKFLSCLPPAHPKTEGIDTADALGRVLAQNVTSPETLPAFSRSTVDGYTVRAADTYGASDSLPVYLKLIGEVPMGGKPRFVLQPTETAVIHTGGMIPEGTDAVVMSEYTQTARPGEVEIYKAVASGQNIIYAGEDLKPGQDVLFAGTVLRPVEIGGLLALGITRIKVAAKPRLGILSSGDEVVEPHEPTAPGQVRDINSYTLSALIESNGGQAVRYGVVKDDPHALEERMAQAMQECDGVVVTAGSSASTRDLTAEVIGRMGIPGVLVHGVNVRPGKPTILGVCDGKPAIGLPGNPVSALVIAGIFIVPTLHHLLGIKRPRPAAEVSAKLTTNVSSPDGREVWMPVKLSASPEGYLAEPIYFKSNLIFNLARADGLMRIPNTATGLPAGNEVKVTLLI